MVRSKTNWWRIASLASLMLVGALTALWAQNEGDKRSALPAKASQTAATAAKHAAEPAKPIPTFLLVGSQREIASRAEINKSLEKTIEVNFDNIPLNEACVELEKKLGISIALDRKALEAAGVGSDTPVSRNLKNVSARSVLRLMLKQLDLTFMIQNEVLLITTSEEANNKMEIRIYPVRDLITQTGPRSATVADGSLTRSSISAKKAEATAKDSVPPDSAKKDNEPATEQTPTFENESFELTTIIKSTVQPSTWDDVGGQGSVKYLAAAGALVLSHTGEVHEEVAQLLEGLREAKRIQE